eukprot:1267041-Alexandrium_andersonii.AAC.1
MDPEFGGRGKELYEGVERDGVYDGSLAGLGELCMDASAISRPQATKADGTNEMMDASPANITRVEARNSCSNCGRTVPA